MFDLQDSDAVALELEELQREQAGYEQQIQAVDEAMKAIQEQIDSMACTVTQNKVPLTGGLCRKQFKPHGFFFIY